MLRKVRIAAATVCLAFITLLFLDFTGTVHAYFGWLAKIQFLPAVLSLNVVVVVGLIALTLVMGRVYCSVICPLGVCQDVVSWLGGKHKKNRFGYSKPLTVLRYGVLAVFVAALVAGVGSVVALLAPYSAFGRIASNLFAPLYQCGNNGLAYLAERADSYAFYPVDVWIRSAATFAIALVTLVVIAVLAWRGGRTYCNTICPVGTVLGFFARFSWLKPVINTDKCNGCGLCARNCKASCINPKEHQIDYSRCVVCFDCLKKCRQGAISYAPRRKATATATNNKVDTSRRAFVTTTAVIGATAAVQAQKMKVDGGLAVIEEKKIPNRNTPITPAGSLSAANMAQHCTGCQLCVSVCPNGVLRPSGNVLQLMQPQLSYERGYCRPECTKCSEVCPAGAIKPITREEKSSTQIGHAVWIKENCVVTTDGVACGNCARHCPSGAITMVPSDPNNPDSPQFPAVNTERCIGCGACENLCPARPFSAIYVEGHEVHRTI